jgi:ABC-2 type transport system permease protein
MRKMMKVAAREYKAIVKTKTFIAILVLVPIMMSGGLIASVIAERNMDTSDKKLAVIDRSGAFGETLLNASSARNENEIHNKESGKKERPAYILEFVEPDASDPVGQRLDLSNRVREGDLHAFVEIGSDIVHPTHPKTGSINYYGQNAVMDNMRGWLEWPINNKLRELRLKDAGIKVSEVQDLFMWHGVNGMGLVSVDDDTGEMTDAKRSSELEAAVIPIVLCMFMYFMLILVSQTLLTSVIEEKTQRIAEVLLGSVKPFEFMMGKLIGSVGVALTAITVYIVGGFTLVIRLGHGSYIPYDLLPWFFTYLILATIMYGAIGAALGSLASDAKDAQSLAFPAMLPLILSLFLAISLIKDPSSTYAVWVSLIPVFTPLVMMFRLGAPGIVPVWQQIAGISGVFIFSFLFVWIGGRVFRIGLLAQGKMPKLKNVIRMAVRG